MAVTVTLSIIGTDDAGGSIDFSHSYTKAAVPRIYQDRIPVGTASEAALVNFGTASAGTLAAASVDTLFVINDDSTNFARVRAQDDAAAAYDTKVEAKRIQIFNSADIAAVEDAAAFTSFGTMDKILGQADTGATDLIVIGI